MRRWRDRDYRGGSAGWTGCYVLLGSSQGGMSAWGLANSRW